ncbi:MAG: DNA mismatch repair endonuclease MutL [Desulfosarcina sp.]|jgi:DNA mismatch repair protein MutL
MSTIRVLPEILANKIAAGEVVERPASVVKELVENALDAGSTRIIVEIEQGGRNLIRVADNGQGMGRDDALLCLERYATSKLRGDSDLFAIRSLGFRGEALPSIASVSRFSLVTRDADADAGTRIEVAGGRIDSVSEVGAPIGTMVSVARLFYNTPARRKFLKSVKTEMGHIADTIASMALCRPAVQFRLTHNNRPIKRWTPAADPIDRVADVLGSVIKQALYPVDRAAGDVQINGWVAAARLKRATSRGIYLFVNGRWVKDRVIQHALFAGYRGRLMKGQYPVAVLLLSVPFDQVDVNVHPTKHEVRFVRQRIVHDAVEEAVAQALRQSDPPRWKTPAAGRSDLAFPTSAGLETAAGRQHMSADRASNDKAHSRVSDRSVPFTGPEPIQNDGVPRSDATGVLQATLQHPDRDIGKSRQSPLWEKRFFADLTVIGQIKGTYLVCEADDGLMLIDQHAAHERIVFEQLKRQSDSSRPASQRLLLPETMDLSFREAQILEKLAPMLDRYGLEIEPFGGNTFVVKAVPTLLDSSDIPAMVRQLAEKTAELGLAADMASIVDECLMVMACHHAIRARQQLSDIQIQAMLEQLDTCDNPSHCPHGRPIWVQWHLRDLEKLFQRIVT